LKVPFAITIGLVGGLLGIIPFVGGVIALILAALSALTVDPMLVLWVTLIFTALVEIEAHAIAPALYGRVTGLHPAVVVIAMLIGFKAGGLVGLIYSIPLAVIGSVLLSEVQSGLATHAEDQSA
jgi:predicted PurR-regulated permease PerM